MPDQDQILDLRIMKCPDCNNLYLRDPSDNVLKCKRDKSELIVGSEDTTRWEILRHARWCQGCGRLTLIITELPHECILCHCPTSIDPNNIPTPT